MITNLCTSSIEHIVHHVSPKHTAQDVNYDVMQRITIRKVIASKAVFPCLLLILWARAPEATPRKPLRPLANKKERWSQQLPGRTNPSILLKIPLKVKVGEENCSQEPAEVFSFSTESTVARKSFICWHSDNAEGLFLAAMLIANEKAYTLVCRAYMLSLCCMYPRFTLSLTAK